MLDTHSAIESDSWHGRVARLMEWLKSDEQLRFIVTGTAGLAVYCVVQFAFWACLHQPESVYSGSVIALGMLASPCPLALVGGSLLILLIGWNKLRWSEFHLAAHTRLLAVGMAVILAYSLGLIEFNYYFGQWHLADRLLLAVLTGLVWYHPAFIGPLLVHAFAVTGQFNHPLPMSLVDKLIVYQTLAVIYVFTCLRLVSRRFDFGPMFFALLTVVAIYYFRPASGKLELNWLAQNHLECITAAAMHQNGWFHWLGVDDRQWIYSLVKTVRPLLMGTALLLELVILFYLAHRRLFAVVLGGLVCMHLGIFASTGILFWKWIILDGILVCIAFRLPESTRTQLFNWRTAIASACVAIPLSFIFAPAPKLAWFDSPLSFRYQIEVVTEDGEVYQLPPYMMEPYDLECAQASFEFLTDSRPVVGIFGATSDAALLHELRSSKANVDLRPYRDEEPTPTDRERAVRFQRLLVERVKTLQPDHRPFDLPVALTPPQHIWSAKYSDAGLEVYQGQKPAKEIRVRLIGAFLQDDDLVRLDDRIVSRIDTQGQRMASNPSGPLR